MKVPRRQFLFLTAAGLTKSSYLARARADGYPSRPVHWIIGFPAGGAGDIMARMLGPWLADRLAQPVIIENRPGAGGNLAVEAVAKSAPDGYTLLQIASPNVINSLLYTKLNFNFIRDIAPAASFMQVPGVMVINPSFPAHTVPEFIAYAKAHPGAVNMASGGNGTAQQMYGELFKMMSGIVMLHVPYHGSPQALTDLIGGQVQVMFDTLPSSIEFIRTGKLRALAVTTGTRTLALPAVPAMGEFLPGYEASGWQGLGVPTKTPSEIVKRLNNEINAALADPMMKARLADLGGTVLALSPSDFGELISKEADKWGKVIKFAGIKPD